MLTADILTPERTIVTEQTYTKKSLLKFISTTFAESMPHLSAEEIYTTLNTRESLGSTAIGHGVAIPHARLASLTGIIGALVYCKQAVDFEALDSKPVDIIFALLVPVNSADDHIKTLAFVTKLFNEEEHRDQIRKIRDNKTLFEIVNDLAAYS